MSDLFDALVHDFQFDFNGTTEHQYLRRHDISLPVSEVSCRRALRLTDFGKARDYKYRNGGCFLLWKSSRSKGLAPAG